jgi:hypothetical protein
MDKVLNKYGSYGDIFTALLKQAAEDLAAAGGEKVQVECSNYDVVHKQEYPEDLDKVDAVLMTGSSKCFLVNGIFCCFGGMFQQEKNKSRKNGKRRRS